MPNKRATVLVVTIAAAAFALAAEPSAHPDGDPAMESLKVLGASYSYGGEHADVTERVKELLREDKTFSANPQWLQGDPHPGMNKALFIFGEVDGQPRMLSVGEDEDVSRAILFKKAWAVSARTEAKIDLPATAVENNGDSTKVGETHEPK